MNDLTVNIGQTEVTSRIPVGQSFVIESQQVQNCRVQVMGARRLFHGLESEFIRGSVGRSAAHSSPCKPDAETVVIMVSSE